MCEGFVSTVCGYQRAYEPGTQISCLSSMQHVLTHVIAQQLCATLHMCTNVSICKSVRNEIYSICNYRFHHTCVSVCCLPPPAYLGQI